MGLGTQRNKKALSEINVTPFVDVMLVLLIIFMMAAPMLDQGIDLELPEVRAQALPQSDDHIMLAIRADGTVHVDDLQLPEGNLAKALTPILTARANEPVFVRADHRVPYGRVAEVLALARQAGANTLHLVTQEPEAQ